MSPWNACLIPTKVCHWSGAEHGARGLSKMSQCVSDSSCSDLSSFMLLVLGDFQGTFLAAAHHSLHTLTCFQPVQLLEMAIGLVGESRTLFQHQCTPEVNLAVNLETSKLILQELVGVGGD